MVALITDNSVPLSEDDALRLAEAPRSSVAELAEAASAVRDRHWGKRITFSPKVFLPVTNLCGNRCAYCAFRRSPSQPGAWTMPLDEIEAVVARAREAGCTEALLCLGDKPERSFPSYRAELGAWGFDGTVDYLDAAARVALRHGLLPHTNAGLLDARDMERLRRVNVSLGLMLETASPRLGLPGMPHHRAPDKNPALRLAMLDDAGRQSIPFTTGILVGIGETRRERALSLLAIREVHRRHGHIQEVIVQNFRAHESTRMHAHAEADEGELAHAIALARLILDPEVSVQAPPNLSEGGLATLIASGVNDLGGISPVTPDYINPGYAWPHIERLGLSCARLGYALDPRLPIYDRFVARPGFVDAGLEGATARARDRLASVDRHGPPAASAHDTSSKPARSATA